MSYTLIQVSLGRCDIAATSEPKDCADRIINQGRLPGGAGGGGVWCRAANGPSAKSTDTESRRRLLQEPSPGKKRLLALSH